MQKSRRKKRPLSALPHYYVRQHGRSFQSSPKSPPKRVLALPDLEQTKSAVLSTLTSKSGQRTYDHAINEFVDWYCSEPRLAFSRSTVPSSFATESI